MCQIVARVLPHAYTAPPLQEAHSSPAVSIVCLTQGDLRASQLHRNSRGACVGLRRVHQCRIMGGEIELRARVAELELELASRDDADRDAEIEELRAAVSMYKAENRKLQGTPGAVRGGRRTTSRTHSNNTEAAHLQVWLAGTALYLGHE